MVRARRVPPLGVLEGSCLVGSCHSWRGVYPGSCKFCCANVIRISLVPKPKNELLVLLLCNPNLHFVRLKSWARPRQKPHTRNCFWPVGGRIPGFTYINGKQRDD